MRIGVMHCRNVPFRMACVCQAARCLARSCSGYGDATHVCALLADEGVEHLVDAPQAGEDGAAGVQAGQRAGAVPDGALDLQDRGVGERGKDDGGAGSSPGHTWQAGVTVGNF